MKGILVHDNTNGANSPSNFVLFDLMAHTWVILHRLVNIRLTSCLLSTSGESGIGDGGADAIEAFKSQHKCNTICEKLNLPACDTIKSGGVDLYEGSDGEDNHNDVPTEDEDPLAERTSKTD